MTFDPASEKYVSLATFRRNGKRVDTPVWIAQSGDYYYVFSEGKAGKVKRIATNPAVQLAACDYRGKLRSDWVEGRARVVSEQTSLDEAYAALDEKYTWSMRIANFLAKITGRFQRRAMIQIELVTASDA